MQIQCYGISHVGKVRARNEDAYFVPQKMDEPLLVIVADGMGGMPEGALASSLAANCFSSSAYGPVKTPEQLRERALQANADIRSQIVHTPQLEGMGTTLTAVLILEGSAYWVHVGDSRLYLQRGNVLTQLTTDHRFIQTLIDHGDITKEEAATHRLRHILDQCLGCPGIEIEQGNIPLSHGDILLLCTDGLYEELAPTAIQSTLAMAAPTEQKAISLLNLALKAGGRDNVTLVVIEL